MAVSHQWRRLSQALAVVVAWMAAASPLIAEDFDSGKPALPGRCRAEVLMEAGSGRLLAEHHARMTWAPASLVKMMVMLIVVEDVRAGKIDWRDRVRVSARASQMGGSQVYLKEGEVFPLEELMMAIAVGSANDASYAVAEHVAGDVGAFIERMNERARRLGMTGTRYANVHGLPALRDHEGNVTCAYDLAVLARELVRHPKVLEWTSTPQYPFRDETFVLRTTNALIGSFPGADGLKTGHLSSSGFNLVATAEQEGIRLIAVVLGASTNRDRTAESRRLLSSGFDYFQNAPAGFLVE